MSWARTSFDVRVAAWSVRRRRDIWLGEVVALVAGCDASGGRRDDLRGQEGEVRLKEGLADAAMTETKQVPRLAASATGAATVQ